VFAARSALHERRRTGDDGETGGGAPAGTRFECEERRAVDGAEVEVERRPVGRERVSSATEVS
jgi:hypothetical protein